MNDFWVVVFMTVIGSLIAGSTNHLAIQMLFRPYNAKYIGKWKVPFTPGIIPARREELAVQLGKTVEDYLMTPEMLKEKLSSDDLKVTSTELLTTKWSLFLENEKTIYDYLENYDKSHYLNNVEDKIREVILSKALELKNNINSKDLVNLLGEGIFMKVSDKVPTMSTYILSNGMTYISSSEGEELIKKMTEDFLGSKGRFAGVIGSLVGDSKSLNDKIRKELINILKSEKTFTALNNLFNQELIKFSKLNGSVILNNLDNDSLINNGLDSLMSELNLKGRLDVKLSDIIPDLDLKVRNEIIPKFVEKGLEMLILNVPLILENLNVKELVRKEVDKFPVEELEQLLLGVTKKEFKMITYLGFLLGGIIGIIQGFFVILF